MHPGSVAPGLDRQATLSVDISDLEKTLKKVFAPKEPRSSMMLDSAASGIDDKPPVEKSWDVPVHHRRRMVPFWQLFILADWTDVALMLGGSVGAVINGAALPLFVLFFGYVVDSFFDNQASRRKMQHEVNTFALAIFGIGMVAMVSSFLEISCWRHTAERQSSRLKSLYLRALLRQEVAFFDMEPPSKDVVQRLNDQVATVKNAMGEKVGNTFHNLSTLVVGATIAFVQCWQLALVILVAFPVVLLVNRLHTRITKVLSARARRAYAPAGLVAEESLKSIRSVQSYCAEERAVQRYTLSLQVPHYRGLQAGLVKGIGMGCVCATQYCLLVLGLWFGSELVIRHRASAGEVITALYAMVYCLNGGIVRGRPLGQLAPNFSAFAKGMAAASRIFDLVNRVPKIDEDGHAGLTLPRVEGMLQLRRVKFAYPSHPQQLVLRDLNLIIPAGKAVALVGASGSGKSTVIALLERFYDPDGGAVVLDGVDVKDLQLRWLRRQMGLVGQEPVLFNASIQENITFGCEGAGLEEVKTAAKAANAHGFISGLPEGYDTIVGEGGVQLSNGQKQRIAIARATLRNPIVLLLDEPTSTLDPTAEWLVQEALDRLMVGRTVVCVAHKPANARAVDEIVVLQNGRVAEMGAHEELMAKGEEGAYVQLLRMQEGFGPAAPSGSEAAGTQQSNDDHPEGSSQLIATAALPSPVTGGLRRRGQRRSSSTSVSSKSLDDDQSGAGVALGGGPVGHLWRLLRLTRHEAPQIAAGLVAALLLGALAPLYGLLTANIINTYFEADEEKIRADVQVYSFVFLSLAAAAVILLTWQCFFFVWIAEALTLRVRQSAFGALLRQEVGWFDRPENTSQLLVEKLEAETKQAETAVREQPLFLAQAVVTMGLAIAITVAMEWRLSLIMFAVMAVIVVVPILSTKAVGKGLRAHAEAEAERADALAMDSVANIRTVAAFSIEDKILELYEDASWLPLQLGVRISRTEGFGKGLSRLLKFGAGALVLWYGATLIRTDRVDFRDVVGVFIVLVASAAAVGAAAGMLPDLRRVQSAVRWMFRIQDRQPEIEFDDPEGQTLSHVDGQVELRRLDFAHPLDPPTLILHDCCLTVPVGKTLALVGMEGAGKSTVLSLIERFYDPQRGAVLVDNFDIRQMRLTWLRSQIALLTNDPAIFSTTIHENILYGRGNASMVEVEAAAHAARATDFIRQLPDGFQSLVQEVPMHMGQKQLLAIARAVLKDPRILLVDDITRDLEPGHVAEVTKALDQLRLGRTTIVVTQDPATMQDADLIAVLHEGSVAEQGTHEELSRDPRSVYSMLLQLYNETR